MEAAWKKSIDLDSTFNHGRGASFPRDVVSRRAGWPLRPRSRTKARRHLQKAVELVPDYPENQICLLEARLNWGEGQGGAGPVGRHGSHAANCRTNYTGEAWARDWRIGMRVEED